MPRVGPLAALGHEIAHDGRGHVVAGVVGDLAEVIVDLGGVRRVEACREEGTLG